MASKYSPSAILLGGLLLGGCEEEECRRSPIEKQTRPEAPQVRTPMVAGADGDDVATTCKAVCEKTVGLKCRNHPKCVESCVESFTMPLCADELTTFLACTAESDAAQFECSDDGIPALRDGVCNEQQAAAVQCFSRRLGR